jgi:hypothetical protein
LYLKNDVEEMRGQKESHDAILEVGQWRKRRECDLSREFLRAKDTVGPAGTPVTVSVNGITNMSTHNTGAYLYAGVQPIAVPGSKAAVAVYTIGSAGALTAVTGSPFTTGTGNAGVAASNVVQ